MKKFGLQLNVAQGFEIWPTARKSDKLQRVECSASHPIHYSVCFKWCFKKKNRLAMCRKVRTFSYTDTGTAVALSAKHMLNVTGLYALRWTIADFNKMSQRLDVKINDHMFHCQWSCLRKEHYEAFWQVLLYLLYTDSSFLHSYQDNTKVNTIDQYF